MFVTSAKASAPAPRSRWRLAAAIGFAVLTTAALTATAMWYLRPSPRVALSKFQFTLPPGELLGGVNRHVVAVSPDGSEIVLVGTPGRLYRRSLADVDVEPIQGTENFQRVLSPTFSPDGRSIAFWAGSDRTLKRITLSGGAAVTLCRAEPPSGMSWGPDGITFGQMAGGILRVSESGGKPEVLVKVSAGALAQSPQVLPDRDHVLFTLAVGPPSDYTRFDTARVVVHSLKTGEQKTLVEGGTDARYLPTGHIVYASGGNLLAVVFDLDRLEPKGTARASCRRGSTRSGRSDRCGSVQCVRDRLARLRSGADSSVLGQRSLLSRTGRNPSGRSNSRQDRMNIRACHPMARGSRLAAMMDAKPPIWVHGSVRHDRPAETDVRRPGSPSAVVLGQQARDISV